MTFDPFGDFQTEGYLRNFFKIKDRSQLSQIEYNNFRVQLPNILTWLEKTEIGYQEILETHSRLFSEIYPWAGQDRSITAPDLHITRGGEEEMFCHPRDCERAAYYALTQARETRVSTNPGTIYSQLCHAHPFLDGNGRTLLIIHTELIKREGYHIKWENISHTEFIKVLTDDLNTPEAGYLDKFLEPYLTNSVRSREQLEAMLYTMKIHDTQNR